MLVKLISSSSGEIIMFSDVAHRLFEIAGKKCTAQGVFTKEQLPESIENLSRAVAEETSTIATAGARSSPVPEISDDDQPKISLAQRAQPILNLMKLTQKENGFLLWHAVDNF